jgi:hypothetical protein
MLLFRAWIEKNTLLPPGNFCNCIFRLDIGCAGLHTISPYPNFCLCHLFNKKQNLQQHHSAARKRASRSAFSLILTWYSDTIHHTLLMEPFFETIWALEGSHSTSWNRSFCAVCRTWRHLITHVGRALLFFVSHFFFLHAFHFGIQSYAWKMTIISSYVEMKLNLIRCNRCSCT